MSQLHLHLLINHLPVFGSILGAIVLVQGFLNKNNQTIIAAYSLLIISAIGAIIAYLTGEGAEEAVENIPGIAKNMIEPHEDFSAIALGALIILGMISLIGIFLTWKKSTFANAFALVTLFISLISFALVARAANLGGKIRHTEIDSDVSIQAESADDD